MGAYEEDFLRQMEQDAADAEDIAILDELAERELTVEEAASYQEFLAVQDQEGYQTWLDMMTADLDADELETEERAGRLSQEAWSDYLVSLSEVD